MIQTLSLLLFFGWQSATANDVSKKYPHGLLTPSYGILKEFDLAVNAWDSEATPLNREKPSGYRYWICAPTNRVLVKLSTWTNIEPLSADDLRQPSNFQIRVETSQDAHYFVSRRNFEREISEERIKEILKIIAQNEHVCVEGEFIEEDGAEFIEGKRRVTTIWVWNRIKSKSSCYAYWDDCDLKAWKKRGYPGKHR